MTTTYDYKNWCDICDDEKYGNMVEMNKVEKRLNAMKKMEDKINSW